jgi:hypothetical protein
MAKPGAQQESYGFVTTGTMSQAGPQGSYKKTCATTAHTSNFAACAGGHMPSSTPDWSALASTNERLADDTAAAAQVGAVPSPGLRTMARRPRRAVAVATAIVTIAGIGALTAATAQASTTSAPAWTIVKRVPGSGFPVFTAVAATGAHSAWAFNGETKPTAWRHSGSAWSKVPFPGKNSNVLDASATSPTNVWAFTNSQALRWNGSRWITERTFPVGGGGIASGEALSARNVWVFGFADLAGPIGTWHFNGRTWTKVASGHGLVGGSGSWAFGGSTVAHWNGHTWTRTSVARLLPKKMKNGLNGPAVNSMYAQSATNVWAVGDGNLQDEGGPLVILHYNGHTWSKVASSSTVGYPYPSLAPDGHGGLWIPVSPSAGGTNASFLHYSGGKLTKATLPVAASKIIIQAVAAIPGTSGGTLAVGYTHSSTNPGNDIVGVILQLGS